MRLSGLGEASELLLAPLPSACEAGSCVAMLRVTGDLAPVMRAYRQQFTDARFTREGLMGDPSYVLVEPCTHDRTGCSALEQHLSCCRGQPLPSATFSRVRMGAVACAWGASAVR